MEPRSVGGARLAGRCSSSGRARLASTPAQHRQMNMKTLSHTQASALQMLLRWGEDLVSRAVASMRPRYRADQIAAVVAESNNPSGA